MKLRKIPVLILFILLLVGGCYTSLFILTEGNHAVILRFGRPVGKGISNAGVHFKMPFIDEVRLVEKRLLSWDGPPNKIPTGDKKYISVDTTSRWRISDPVKFIESVHSERGARSRINNILESITRDLISGHNLVETVRNSNEIINRAKIIAKDELANVKVDAAAEEDEGQNPENSVELEVIGELEKVKIGREKLSQMITVKANEKLGPFGITIVDVQLRRIAYEKSVEDKVYNRMISERMRMAEKITAYGKAQMARIEGRIEFDLKNIESGAYKKVQIIKGEAEAAAISIYAKAFSSDPAFFEFQKTMDAYKNAIQKKSKLMLSTDSPFFKFLK